MDELLWADEDLKPITILDDGEGGTIEIYADGSYCTKINGGLERGLPEPLSAP